MRVRPILFFALALALASAAPDSPPPQPRGADAPPLAPPQGADAPLLAPQQAAEAIPLAPPGADATPLAASDSSQTPDEMRLFAAHLVRAADWAAHNYVRPVSRAQLLHAALAGLYEAARRPVPRHLRQRIDRAEKETAKRAPSQPEQDLPAPIMPVLAPQRVAIADERPLIEMVRAVRAEIGKAAELGNEDPLRICSQAMLHSLDPWSGVITAEEHQRTIGVNGERDGFGLEVRESGGRVFLSDVVIGGPGQRAGLRTGDEIVRLHDSDDRPRNLLESLEVLNGRTPLIKPNLGPLASPEPISVTYRRAGGRTERRVKLDWQHFRPETVFGVVRRRDNSWIWWLDAERKIAHLRLGNLTEHTADELADIISRLLQDGMSGLILDLRWCPGGSLRGAVKCAEMFLGEGTIATVHWRNEPETVYRSTEAGKIGDFPLVLILNGESTGGAELIAASLQDHHRAVLVGQRSRGKGNVQKLESIGPIGLKLTSGAFIRPAGKALHRFPDSQPTDEWGVSPDRPFRISPDLDRALQTWWQQQTLRPGCCTERLPLDDPTLDPQRNAALETMRTQLKDQPSRRMPP